MRKRLARFLVLVIIALLLCAGCKAPPTSFPFWEVQDVQGHTRMYLFGSMHLADASLYPLPNAITKAYRQSDALVVECDIAAPDTLATVTSVYQSMMYPDGSTIQDYVPAGLYARMKQALQAQNLYFPAYDSFSLPFWVDLLDSLYLQAAELSGEYGADMHFLSLAHQTNKPIIELESVAFQLRLTSQESTALQLRRLEETLFFLENDPERALLNAQLAALYDAWRHDGLSDFLDQTGWQEQSSLFSWADAWIIITRAAVEHNQAFLQAYQAYAAYTDTLPQPEAALYEEKNRVELTDRNQGMAAKLLGRLAQTSGVSFVVVGAAHMYGETGLVQQLQSAGYAVLKR